MAIFGLIKAPHRKPTTSQNKANAKPVKSQPRTNQEQAASSKEQIPMFSTPKSIMDSQFGYWNEYVKDDEEDYEDKEEEEDYEEDDDDYDDYDDTNDY